MSTSVLAMLWLRGTGQMEQAYLDATMPPRCGRQPAFRLAVPPLARIPRVPRRTSGRDLNAQRTPFVVCRVPRIFGAMGPATKRHALLVCDPFLRIPARACTKPIQPRKRRTGPLETYRARALEPRHGERRRLGRPSRCTQDTSSISQAPTRAIAIANAIAGAPVGGRNAGEMRDVPQATAANWTRRGKYVCSGLRRAAANTPSSHSSSGSPCIK